MCVHCTALYNETASLQGVVHTYMIPRLTRACVKPRQRGAGDNFRVGGCGFNTMHASYNFTYSSGWVMERIQHDACSAQANVATLEHV